MSDEEIWDKTHWIYRPLDGGWRYEYFDEAEDAYKNMLDKI